jgi:tetratricopeptide (TPR) repeat protein
MMSVDPYQNCPCGSGKKFKWCCQKVARFVERAQQLLEDDQVAAATQAIDEGLAVEPKNLWLRTNKARILLSTHDHDAAYPLLDEILADSPGHRPALQLRLEDQLVHGAMTEAVATCQDLLEATPAADAEESIPWLLTVGRLLSEVGLYFAALQHLRFVSRLEPLRKEAASDITRLEVNAELMPWIKDTYTLRPAPSANGVAERWRLGLEHAAAGRWREAAMTFVAIATEQPTNAAAHFNVGLCLAWITQSESAIASLERSAQLDSDEESAVQTLALAMCLYPRESEQTVDVVRLRYTIRDPSRLIQRLKDHDRFQVHVLDAPSEEGEDVARDEFFLLDKDRVKDTDTLSLENAPQVDGVLRTHGGKLELEFVAPTDDDPRERLVVQAAGDTIDPTPEREAAGTEPLSVYRLQRLWGLPREARPDALHRIRRLANEHSIRHIWPDTPHGWLQSKTPREAAGVPELKRHLRAALLVEEYTIETGQFGFDLDELRRELGLEREPTLEGDAADVDHLPLGRLRQVRAATLAAPRLTTLFNRAIHHALTRATLDSADAIVARPTEVAEASVVTAYRLLIEYARRRADRAAAMQWLERARAFDTSAGRTPRKSWDVSEWLVSFELDKIEESAPRLAELLIKCRDDAEASKALSTLLMQLGLTRLVPHPTDLRKVVFDARPLEYLLARYGVRQLSPLDLTPLGGGPGKIWTPDADVRTGGSPIVLPGHEPAAPQRSKLVIPGN